MAAMNPDLVDSVNAADRNDESNPQEIYPTMQPGMMMDDDDDDDSLSSAPSTDELAFAADSNPASQVAPVNRIKIRCPVVPAVPASTEPSEMGDSYLDDEDDTLFDDDLDDLDDDMNEFHDEDDDADGDFRASGSRRSTPSRQLLERAKKSGRGKSASRGGAKGRGSASSTPSTTGSAKIPGRRGRRPKSMLGDAPRGPSIYDIPLPDATVELEKILFRRYIAANNEAIEQTQQQEPPLGDQKGEFLVKFKNRSYLHCEWVDREWIELNDKRGKQRLKHFLEKTVHEIPYASLSEDRPFNESYVKIDRLIAQQQSPDPFSGEMTQWFLVKWQSMQYDQCTWESEALLLHECDYAEDFINEFKQREQLPNQRDPKFFNTYLPIGVRPPAKNWKQMEESPEFKDGNQLRSYQLEGLNWLMYCWYHQQSCIIADEMGLGKTVQSITFLNQLYQMGVRGPFLIVAPLSTIPHWERTVEGWTEMNGIVFHGSANSRGIIQNYEFYYCDPKTRQKMTHLSVPIAGRAMQVPQMKFDVLITTYEMAMSASTILKTMGTWRVVVVDEAHRLKNKSSKVGEILKTYSFEHRLLLTGTPLQNNLEELWSILNFMDPQRFPDGTERQFLQEYDIRSAADVERLQLLLKPLMLRRLKEDVEKTIPVKEETIIEVEMTNIQRLYYRAILERNFQFLRQGTKKANVPNLVNTMMELRKCCIHPYLITGAEEKVIQDEKAFAPQDQFRCMIQASGKLVLLDKLLPKLKAGGHRVLLFSQMTRCLDILQDYLRGRGYLYERIDGGIRGEARQQAIDRFSAEDSEVFIFLLCTRAGGVGINLTAADTCIIFDSDWNPQNDLQAQARCHRIGQKKNVKIYRLIMRDTYEKTMFDKAGMKLGLDKAVLSRMEFDPNDTGMGGGPPSSMSKQEIEDLLKRGAYAALETQQDDSGPNFVDEDIDSILERRTKVIRHDDGEKQAQGEGKDGSLFSKATFALNDTTPEALNMDDPEFWDKWAQKANIEAVTGEDGIEEQKLIVSGPRKRKTRKRKESNAGTLDEDLEGVISEGGDDDNEDGTAGKGRNRSLKGQWTLADRTRLERGLMLYGFGAWEKKKEWFPKRTINEIKAAEIRLMRYCMEALRKNTMKPVSTSAAAPSDDESTTGKGKAAANISKDAEARMNREDARMFEDIAAIISANRWEIPTLADVEKMVKEGCAQSFQPALTEKLDVDPKLGEYPFPGATREDLLIHRSFLDEAPASYFEHLTKKTRNLLLRIQNINFIRQWIVDVDPHAAGDVWVLSENPVAEGEQPKYVNKYDDIYRVRLQTFVYPNLYYQLFTDNGGMTGWGADEDRDVLYGIAKYGYQTYDKMIADPQFVFSNELRWVTNEAKLAEVKEATPDASPNLFPNGSDLGNRVRRLLSTFQRDVRENKRKDFGFAPATGSSFWDSDDLQHRWCRRDRSSFVQTLSMFGLPDEKLMKMNVADAIGRRVSGRAKYGVVKAYIRDWRMFQEIAGLQHKTDAALDAYAEAVIRRLEEIISGRGFEPAPAVSKGAIPLDFSGQPVDPCETVQPDRAKRIIRRIAMFNTLRSSILIDPQLDVKINGIRRSPGLPEWWIPAQDDRDLLRGIAKHGVFGTRQHLIVFDPEFGFRNRALDIIRNRGLMHTFIDPFSEEARKKYMDEQLKKQEEQRDARNREAEDGTGPNGNSADDMAVAMDEEDSSTAVANGKRASADTSAVVADTSVPGTPAADSSAATLTAAPHPVTGAINVEELINWPKDIIRLRRVDIMIDMCQNPAEKLNYYVPFRSDNESVTIYDRHTSLMDDESAKEEMMAQAVKRLRAAVQLVRQFAQHEPMRALLGLDEELKPMSKAKREAEWKSLEDSYRYNGDSSDDDEEEEESEVKQEQQLTKRQRVRRRIQQEMADALSVNRQEQEPQEERMDID